MSKNVCISQRVVQMLDSIRAQRHCSYDAAISLLLRTGKIDAGLAWGEAANQGIDALRAAANYDHEICQILEDLRVALVKMHGSIPARALRAAAAFRAAIEAAQL